MENYNPSIKIARKREGAFLDTFLSMPLFRKFYNYSNLLLGVLLKRNMGRRHFSVTSVFKLTVILIALPLLFFEIYKLYLKYHNGVLYQPDLETFWPRYYGWYVFIGLFVWQAFNRWRETRKKPLWNLQEQSFYGGDSAIWPLVETLLKKPVTQRRLECFYEPLLFLVIGLVLIWLDQRLGTLLFWASIFYGFDQTLAYRKGLKTVMDKADELQSKQAVQQTILGNTTPTNDRTTYHTEKPPITMPLKPTSPSAEPPKNDDPMIAN